ncbi:hypothetical protein P168DRAFT_251949, partial [Aspergillus campestris IBT 28561]
MGSASPPPHALVFGASGINGWAFVNALLSDYPSADAFQHVTAFTNRPLSAKDAQWPASSKLQLVSGLDLVGNDEAGVQDELQKRVPHIEGVTAIYFCAYVFDSDNAREIDINVGMLKKVVLAVEKLSVNLKVVALPTGVKEYGVHLLENFPFADNLPLKETHPPLSEPYRSELFYTYQLDFLRTASANKPWTHVDVRPDIIIGFVPNNSLHNLAQWIVLYLALFRYIHGPGTEAIFPGTAKSWKALSNDSSQDIIARFCIHLSLHTEEPGIAGGSFNVSDNAVPSSWEEKWPVVCEYFGLKGVAPVEGGPEAAAFLEEHQDDWAKMEKDYGLRTGHHHGKGDDKSLPFVPFFLLSQFDFDRQVDLTRMHAAWGPAKEERDIKATWYTTFERYRAAGIIP